MVENLTVTEWTPLAALPRGKTYFWQVRAIKGEKEFLAPQPQQPDAKFMVLSQAEHETLLQAEKNLSHSQLALGVIYANAGLREEAQSALHSLQAKNPQSQPLKAILQNLQH